MILDGVQDHSEGLDVEIIIHEKTNRLVIKAYNEGGYNHTMVDLIQLLDWVETNNIDVCDMLAFSHTRECVQL